MQPQEAPEPQAPDLVTTIILRMRHLGVSGLPRNYELFYAAAVCRNGELANALAALGRSPCQHDLDQLSRRFIGSDRQGVVEQAHDTIASKLDEILHLLRKERCSMETYGQILGETSQGLDNRSAMSREFLDKIVGVMASATKTSIENRTQLVLTMSDKASELREVRAKLEEYKKLADTDALTQLANRRGFDRALARIYDSNRGVAFGALIVADIDRFKPINDRFGHPVGDRIIQIVAGLIRKAVKEGALVARTGGEEFAIILEGMGEDSAAALAEQIRVAVMEAPFVNVANGTNYGPISLSLGTCMATQASGPDDLYMKADRALYAAKSAGRNRVMRFSALTEGNLAKNWLLYRRD